MQSRGTCIQLGVTMELRAGGFLNADIELGPPKRNAMAAMAGASSRKARGQARW